ncbi:MAG TPA: type II secretion system protein [Kiritimatiellia bacterium]|nr:type II secretion system protein [Kiritimatiellia bacterium]
MTRSQKQAQRRGFTIVELLVVISIMAVLATLATGAAIKSIRQSRNKRVEMTAKSLEAALMGYRALKGGWPEDVFNPSVIDEVCSELKESSAYARTVTYGEHSHSHGGSYCSRSAGRFKAKDNHRIFKEVFAEVKRGRALLDTSSILTSVTGGGRMTVREALDQNKGEIPVGYVNPDNQGEFKFFKVQYNFDTDSVTVGKDD